jgi:hypothetical protein
VFQTFVCSDRYLRRQTKALREDWCAQNRRKAGIDESLTTDHDECPGRLGTAGRASYAIELAPLHLSAKPA